MAEGISIKVPARAKDLTGKRFGHLVVQSFHASTGGNVKWRCLCDCGKETIVNSCQLGTGHTRSCGCRKGQTHGMARSAEYRAWDSMIQRCENTKHPNFPRYGGRGITVCAEWHTFGPFFADMGPRPKGKHGTRSNYSIERKNNDGPYCKDNCVWATRAEQENNKRSNRPLTFHGKTQSIYEWSKETGIPHSTIRSRLRYGWPVDRVLTEPIRKSSRVYERR
jgi:hypothetical protein